MLPAGSYGQFKARRCGQLGQQHLDPTVNLLDNGSDLIDQFSSRIFEVPDPGPRETPSALL
jgi:hypothetical protein